VPAGEEPAVKDDVAIPAPAPPPSPTHVSASTDSGDTHEDQAAPSDDVTISAPPPLVDAASAPASQLAPLTNSASDVAAVTETSNTSAPSDSSSNEEKEEEQEEEQEEDNHLDSPSAPSPSALIAMLEQMATDLAAYKVQAMQEREEDRVKQKNLQKVIDQEWRRAVEDLTQKCAKQDKEIGLLQRKCQGLDQSLKDIKRERELASVALSHRQPNATAHPLLLSLLTPRPKCHSLNPHPTRGSSHLPFSPGRHPHPHSHPHIFPQTSPALSTRQRP
jgi:hypothetical protein